MKWEQYQKEVKEIPKQEKFESYEDFLKRKCTTFSIKISSQSNIFIDEKEKSILNTYMEKR